MKSSKKHGLNRGVIKGGQSFCFREELDARLGLKRNSEGIRPI